MENTTGKLNKKVNKGVNKDTVRKNSIEAVILAVKDYTGHTDSMDNTEVSLLSYNEILSNKKIDYRVYSLLVLKSKFNPETKELYIYNKDVEVEQMAKVLGISASTVKLKIKELRTQGILIPENTQNNGMLYKIVSSIDNKYFIRIKRSVLTEFIGYTVIKSNMKEFIQTYILINSLCYKEDREITRDFILNTLKLTINSKQREKITKYTTLMQDIGVIIKTRMNKTKWIPEISRIQSFTITKYRIIRK